MLICGFEPHWAHALQEAANSEASGESHVLRVWKRERDEERERESDIDGESDRERESDR